MKSFLTLALVALLFTSAFAVPKTHYKSSSSNDVVVQETVADSENLDDNVVDNDNTNLNTVNNNVVNEQDSLSNANVETTHNTPVAPVAPVVAPVVSTPVVNTVVNSAPTKTLHHQRSVVTPVVHNVVKTQAPVVTTSVVKSVQAPQTQVVYSQVPQQQVWSVQPQTHVVKSEAPTQVWSQVVPQQQWQSSVVPEQQVVYQVQPQQQWQTQQWQTPVVYQSQPQKTESVVYSQVPQQQQVSVVLRKNHVQPTLVRKNVVLEQTRPVQYTKTVATKLANPQVYVVSPSKTVARQSVLTGAQLVSDVADESAKSDVVVQEVEQNY